MSSVVPEGWRAERLGDVSSLITKGTTPKTYTNEGVNFIKVESISTNRTLIMDKFSKVDLETYNLQKRSQLESGDILFSIAGSLGRIAVVRSEHLPANTNQALALIRLKDGDIDNAYCIQQLSAGRVQSELKNLQTVGAQPNLSLQQVSDLLINCPPLPEQKKIASILTSVDEVIENTQKQIDKLQDLKKATMNELLTKGIGHTEFKDSELGRIPKSWGVSLIEEVCKVGTGKRDTQNKTKYGKYPFFVRSQTIERIDSYSFDGEAILTAGDGVGTGKVFHYVNGRFDFHQRVYKLSDFRGDALGKFLYYCFSSRFLKQVQQFSARGSVESVRMEMITGMAIPLPSIQEQSKIVDCISAIETNISIGKQKLTQTESLKKSLMQDLLTGKVRVTVN
ncbi:restriction endonuclease subunit S [Pseudomonadales bacterium]|nr:restriction endonuclease subunit S [Pseudomonadales bacterium]